MNERTGGRATGDDDARILPERRREKRSRVRGVDSLLSFPTRGLVFKIVGINLSQQELGFFHLVRR